MPSGVHERILELARHQRAGSLGIIRDAFHLHGGPLVGGQVRLDPILVALGGLKPGALFVALFPDGVYGRPYEPVAARAMLALLVVPAFDVLTSPTVDVAPGGQRPQ